MQSNFPDGSARIRTDAELAAELNRAGLKTGAGRSFDAAAVNWLRFAYQIERPRLLAPDELNVTSDGHALSRRAQLTYNRVSTERG